MYILHVITFALQSLNLKTHTLPNLKNKVTQEIQIFVDLIKAAEDKHIDLQQLL